MELFKKNIISTPTENEVLRNSSSSVPQENNPARFAGPSIKQRIIGATLEIGAGVASFHATEEGIWLGAVKFDDAPFKVSMAGDASIGNILLTSGSHIRSGQTDYNTGTGFWLGDVSGTAKFSIGNPAGNYLTWNGTTLTVKGAITGSTITGTTITGGTLQTATGEADKIVVASNILTLWQESGGTAYERVIIGAGSISLLNTSGVGSGAILGIGTNKIAINTGAYGYYFDESAFYPSTHSALDLGTASDYWNEINYKTLTDRGCLGVFDKGVVLQDGSKVSDIDALKSIKQHSTLKTTYGVPRFDYSTMPKVVYKPAPIAENDIYDENDKEKLLYKKGEKMGEDGAETTALISIMIGALKEIDNRLNKLEKNK